MSNIPILYFRLEGVLQSWGEHSKWDNRDTDLFPTKSGIVGLLACALGYERGSAEIVNLSSCIKLAVRADRKGSQCRDFQTIYSDNLMSAKGKRRDNGGTIISVREYLEDSSFLVCVTSDPETLIKCKSALNNPKWQLYLGRKSCVPSLPIIGTITNEYNDLDEAMNFIPLTERHDDIVMYQKEYESGNAIRRLDEIFDAGSRKYMPRFVEICTMKGQV